MENEQQAALCLHDVMFSYDERPFMQGFNLEVPRGAVTGIVGPNGCGKSTALKLAVGLLKPRQGEVYAAGQRLSGMGQRARARLVSYMPQNTAATSMTVQELVLCGRYAYLKPLQTPGKEDFEAAAQAMRLAGVERLRGSALSQLSGGQRQRAHIAMMLAQNADVMLLDEPTSALDIGASHEMLSLVRSLVHGGDKLAGEGAGANSQETLTGVPMSIVLVLHDLDLALRYCDHVIVMDDACVVCEGTPRQVLDAGALERVFKVDVRTYGAPEAPAYAFYPQEPSV